MKRLDIFSSLLSLLSSAAVRIQTQRQSLCVSSNGLGRILFALLAWFVMLPTVAQLRIDASKGAVVKIERVGDPGTVRNFQYSYSSNSGWTDLNSSGISLTNTTVYLRLKSNTNIYSLASENGYHRITVSSGTYTVSGDPTSLIKRDRTTTIRAYTFRGLFSGSTNLTSASGLSISGLTPIQSCFESMFEGCTALTAAPALSNKQTANECYKNMFKGCTALTAAPSLNATTLATSCYEGMFQNSGITSMPALNVGTLSNACYKNMFNGCTGITTASLGATTLAEESCSGMFFGCINLTSLSVSFSDWNAANNATTDWVTNVNKEGTFVCYSDLSPLDKDVSHVPVNFNIQMNDRVEKSYLCFTAGVNGSKIRLSKGDDLPTGVNGFMYNLSTEGDIKLGANWHVYNYQDLTLNNGQSVYFRAADDGNGALYEDDTKYCRFVVSAGRFTVSGNLCSLLNRSVNNGLAIPSKAFSRLFMDCKGINVSDLVLPNRTATYCYDAMFQGSDITTTPALPATALTNYCYRSMFQDCQNLTSAPVLDASTMKSRCYQYMFKGCKSLTVAPALRATTLNTYCYDGMFAGCTNLVSAPALPATKLSSYCYRYMFQDCVRLMTIPQLAATELATTITDGVETEAGISCCRGMFQRCSALENVPELLVKDLQSNCYREMFDGCSNLKYISVQFSDWKEASNATLNWVQNVAEQGTFLGPTDITEYPILNKSHIPVGWICTAPDFFAITNEGSGSATVKLTVNGSVAPVSLMYSLDGLSWELFDNATGVELPASKQLYLRATNAKGHLSTSAGNYYQFDFGSTTANTLSLSGNIMSLVDYTCQSVAIPDNYAFCNIFNGATALKDVSELRMPATNLTTGCYYQMFYGCSNIKVAPALPAMAMTNNCYQGMFRGCSSLVTAPELQSTRLAQNCYESMFRGCTSLGVAPHLPATTLATGCYNNLFNGCSNLHYISVEFTTWNTSCTSNWVNNVAETGTFAHKGLSQTVNTSQWPRAGLAIWGGETYGSDQLCFIATEDNSNGVNIKIKNKGTKTIYLTATTKEVSAKNVQIEIAPNGEWSSHNEGRGSIFSGGLFTHGKLTEKGYTLFIKAQNGKTNTSFDGCNFEVITDEGVMVEMKGNVNSLIKADCSVNPGPDAFRGLFKGCVKIHTSPTLPATTVGAGAYAYMFEGCTGLVSTPELPATNLGDGCYEGMFKGCTGLKSAANLGAENLTTDCYMDMFYGCSGLVKAPDINARTMGYQSCQGMFQGCTSLVVAPALNTADLATSCYKNMFNGCTKLTEAPALDVERLADNCYQGMFSGCERLSSSPKLPSTTLATYCYSSMFEGCSKLTQVPELNATALQVGCYQAMFKDCKKLATAPELPATSLNKNYCYANMFDGCSELSMIKTKFDAWYAGSANNTTSQWVRDVADEGAFICNLTGSNIVFGENNIPNLETGTKKHWTVINDNLCFEARSKNSTVSLKIPAGFRLLYFETNPMVWNEETTAWETDIENRKWREYVSGTTITLHKVKDRVFFKAGVIDAMTGLDLSAKNMNAAGTSYQFSTNSKYYSFSITGNVVASGHVASLLDDVYTNVTSLPAYSFYRLFYKCSGLYLANELKLEAVNLGAHCYEEMFSNCEYMTQGPVLPAMEMSEACYKGMFQNCYNLSKVPALNAKTLANNCYEGMFENCREMKKAMSKLPAMTLQPNCYQSMFRGCETLGTAPQLPATQMAVDCYREMFNGCIRLQKAPKLPAKSAKLAARCYREMFENCESLTSLNVGFGLDTWKNQDPSDENHPTYLWVNEWGGIGERGADYSQYSFSAPVALVNEIAASEDDVYFGVSRVPKYWTSQELPIATFPNEDVQMEPDYVFSSSSGASLPVIDDVNEVLHIAKPSSTSQYELQIPYYAKVEKIRVEGTTDGSEGTFVITGATVSSNSRGDKDVTTNLAAKGGTEYAITYDVAESTWGQTFAFTLDQGFNGVISLYGELKTYTELPTWHYDYVDNVLTMDCEHGAAQIYYVESDVCPFDYNTDFTTGSETYTEALDCKSWANQPGFGKRTFWAIAKNPAKELASHPVKIVIAKYSPMISGYCLVQDGNAANLAEAIEYANIASDNDYRVQIFVPNGTYTLSEPICLSGEWFSVIGQSVEGTIIEGNVTVAASAKDLYLQDLKVSGTFTDLGVNTEWRSSGDANQEQVANVNRNGSTLTISPEKKEVNTFLVELEGDYTIADYKSFYVTTNLDGYADIKVRAANGRGGFGPASTISNVVNPEGDVLMTAKLNSSGYATFGYCDQDNSASYLQSKGASAYVATFDGVDIVLEQINDQDIIPANTGVILFGSAGQTVQFYAASAPGKSVPENDLKPYTLAYDKVGEADYSKVSIVTPDGWYGSIYALSGNQIKKLAKNGKIAKNKAYFDLDGMTNNDNPAPSYRMIFGRWSDEFESSDNTVAVDVIHTNHVVQSDFVYDLQGRKTNDKKGLIIKNGKVIMVK